MRYCKYVCNNVIIAMMYMDNFLVPILMVHVFSCDQRIKLGHTTLKHTLVICLTVIVTHSSLCAHQRCMYGHEYMITYIHTVVHYSDTLLKLENADR